jgi:hypothetical protein
MLIKLSFLCI